MSRAFLLPLLQAHLKPHFQFGHFHKRPELVKKLRNFLHDAQFVENDVSDDFIANFAKSSLESDGIPSERFFSLFLDFGLDHDISYCYIGPQFEYCLKCGPKPLHREVKSHAILYTLRLGPIPVITEKARCLDCKTTYHPTYSYVHENGEDVRTYYGQQDIIEVTPNAFFEKDLCTDQANYIAHAWVSFGNLAKIYNCRRETEQLERYLYDVPKYKSALMHEDHVNQAFFLNALLAFAADNGEDMQVRATNISDVLSQKCEERTNAWKDRGSPYLLHACDQCTWHKDDEYVQACVCDGVCIGRMCCAVRGCSTDLVPGTRFCKAHAHFNVICEVEGCEQVKREGHRTCVDPEHVKSEDNFAEANKALTQLQKHASGANMADDNKSSLRLARKRAVTHNEQFVIATCGIIKARTTFRDSESLPATVAWWKRLYPNANCMPTVMFYDNNCSLRRHIKKQDPTSYLLDKILVVDVFHHKSKHKKNFEECERDCNPSLYPDLIIDKGDKTSWRFNSSACEQQNSWLVGFQSILREMKEWKYHFFLDEVSKIRNDTKIVELRRRNACPYFMEDKAV